MFGIGGFELFIILVFAFLIFGPEKLPEIATTIGKFIAKFRNAQNEMNEIIKGDAFYDPNSDEPFKNPLEALENIAQQQEAKNAKSSASAESVQTAAASAASDGEPKKETFSERKARYERERAARKKAEEEAQAAAAAAAAAPEETAEEAVEIAEAAAPEVAEAVAEAEATVAEAADEAEGGEQ